MTKEHPCKKTKHSDEKDDSDEEIKICWQEISKKRGETVARTAVTTQMLRTASAGTPAVAPEGQPATTGA